MTTLMNMCAPSVMNKALGGSPVGTNSSSSPCESALSVTDYNADRDDAAMSNSLIMMNGCVAKNFPGGGGGGDDDSMMVMSQSMDSINTIGTHDGSSDGVRTLFVSGLPLDTKARELYLLFRGYKGYLSSTLKPAGKNGKLTAPVGFVTFETREQAEAAMADLKGVKFDPEGTQHLRLEFARSNTKVTKPKNTLTGIPSPLNPLGLAGVLAANGMCTAMPVVSSGGASFAQQIALSASNHPLSLANLQAAMAGNSNSLMPQLFNTLTPFDTALMQSHDVATSQSGWSNPTGSAGLQSHHQNNQFDNATLLSQAAVGLLTPANLANTTGANFVTSSQAAAVANLTHQAALIHQANSFRQALAVQLSGVNGPGQGAANQQHPLLNGSQHPSPVNNGVLASGSSNQMKLSNDESISNVPFGF